MNSSIACRYPRFDSGERRLSRTADLLWSRSGRPSFDFGRFSFEDFRLACLLIPAASTAAGQEPMPDAGASGVIRQVEMTPASREPVSWHAVTRDLNRYRVVSAMAIYRQLYCRASSSQWGVISHTVP